MSIIKIVLLALQFVQYMVKRADERRLISQGERNEVLASLNTIRGMVGDADKIEQSVGGMSDDDVTRELQTHYGNGATGPGEPGHGGGKPESGVVLSGQQVHPRGR